MSKQNEAGQAGASQTGEATRGAELREADLAAVSGGLEGGAGFDFVQVNGSNTAGAATPKLQEAVANGR